MLSGIWMNPLLIKDLFIQIKLYKSCSFSRIIKINNYCNSPVFPRLWKSGIDFVQYNLFGKVFPLSFLVTHLLRELNV